MPRRVVVVAAATVVLSLLCVTSANTAKALDVEQEVAQVRSIIKQWTSTQLRNVLRDVALEPRAGAAVEELREEALSDGDARKQIVATVIKKATSVSASDDKVFMMFNVSPIHYESVRSAY